MVFLRVIFFSFYSFTMTELYGWLFARVFCAFESMKFLKDFFYVRFFFFHCVGFLYVFSCLDLFINGMKLISESKLNGSRFSSRFVKVDRPTTIQADYGWAKMKHEGRNFSRWYRMKSWQRREKMLKNVLESNA